MLSISFSTLSSSLFIISTDNPLIKAGGDGPKRVGLEGFDGSSTLDVVVVEPDTSGGLPAKKVSKTFLKF